jgi:hypothetical protein
VVIVGGGYVRRTRFASINDYGLQLVVGLQPAGR